MTDSFSEYVDLVSTASKELYPDNNNSSFINVLPIPLSLPLDCYVSLEEIGYTNSYYNVVAAKSKVAIMDVNHKYPPRPDTYGHPYPVWGRYVNVTLDTGYYDKPEMLINMLNQRVRTCGVIEVADRDIFRYDPVSRKVFYDMKGMQATVQIRGPLIHLLGVEITTPNLTDEQFVALGMAKEGPTFVYTHKKKKDEGEKGKDGDEGEKGKDGEGEGGKGEGEGDKGDGEGDKGESGKGGEGEGEGKKETRHWSNPSYTYKSAGMEGVMEYPLQLTPHSSMVVYSDIVRSQVSS